ncbi:Dystrophin-related protein 2 [Varanus komodoensis]|nr:Dystrophin-related protein 2 [Varanus komodoensis]
MDCPLNICVLAPQAIFHHDLHSFSGAMTISCSTFSCGFISWKSELQAAIFKLEFLPFLFGSPLLLSAPPSLECTFPLLPESFSKTKSGPRAAASKKHLSSCAPVLMQPMVMQGCSFTLPRCHEWHANGQSRRNSTSQTQSQVKTAQDGAAPSCVSQKPPNSATGPQMPLEMNLCWNEIKKKSHNLRARLEAFSDHSGKLQIPLQEIIDWLSQKDEELSAQLPLRGDVLLVQQEKERHAVFMEEVKSRGPYIYSVLESAQAFLTQHPFEEVEDSNPDSKDVSPRHRIQNISRFVWKQATVASELWEKLTARCVDQHRHIERTLEQLLEIKGTMEELSTTLNQAESVRETWEPIGDLFIDSLPEHIQATKVAFVRGLIFNFATWPRGGGGGTDDSVARLN